MVAGRDNLTTRLPGLPATPLRPQRLQQPRRSMARVQNLARTHASQETALNHPIGADASHAASDAAAAPNESLARL